MNDETIGNQQETPTEAELGWLAGIVDGEGSITMNVRQKHWNGWNGVGIDLQVIVVNTDAGIIEKALKIFQKIGVQPHLYEKSTNPIQKPSGDGVYHNRQKTLITLQVSKMGSILKILSNMTPHLAGEKKSRANLITQFIERRLTRQTSRSKGGPTWYDGYDWDIVKKFYALKGGKLLPEVERLLNEQTQPQQIAG